MPRLSPPILYESQLAVIRRRKLALSMFVWAYTGVLPPIAPHPHLRSPRLRWSSTASPSAINPFIRQ